VACEAWEACPALRCSSTTAPTRYLILQVKAGDETSSRSLFMALCFGGFAAGRVVLLPTFAGPSTPPGLLREHAVAEDVKRLKGEAALEHEHEHLLSLLSSSSSEGSSRFNVRLPRHEAYPGSLQRFRHFRRAGKNAPAGVERHRPICVLITIPAAFQAPDLAGRARIIQL
jgi:hypothetical protein